MRCVSVNLSIRWSGRYRSHVRLGFAPDATVILASYMFGTRHVRSPFIFSRSSLISERQELRRLSQDHKFHWSERELHESRAVRVLMNSDTAALPTAAIQ
jgi:hypothetical protein